MIVVYKHSLVNGNLSVHFVKFTIRSYHLRALRKHIALVRQEPICSIKIQGQRRLQWGVGGGSLHRRRGGGSSENGECPRVPKRAKGWYETCCGQRRVHLSGGKKQRICHSQGRYLRTQAYCCWTRRLVRWTVSRRWWCRRRWRGW